MIGSDQVADLDGAAIGKPGDHARADGAAAFDARPHRRLPDRGRRRLRGDSGFARSALAPVTVRFRDLSDAEIEHYLRAEQPYDCAGSAKTETLGIALLEAIDSDDPTALIGLPLIRTCALLRRAGIDPLPVARRRRRRAMTAPGTLLPRSEHARLRRTGDAAPTSTSCCRSA